ncbi:putative legumain protein [Helianthus anomalus]
MFNDTISAVSMKTSRLICWLVTVMVLLSLSHAEQSHRVRGIKQRDVYPSYLWERYKSSSTIQKPKVAKEIRDAVTKLAYLDSRIDMLGLILFGPQKFKSILRVVRYEKRPMVDDQRCLKSTLKLFEKHCGVLTDHDMKQSLANICNYMVEKAAIKEAIIIACGKHDIEESHGIDVGNPKVNVTPAPVRGTFEYCGRVIVNGVSRRQLGSYAKAYQITVVPSKQILDSWHNMIQICFHQ